MKHLTLREAMATIAKGEPVLLEQDGVSFDDGRPVFTPVESITVSENEGDYFPHVMVVRTVSGFEVGKQVNLTDLNDPQWDPRGLDSRHFQYLFYLKGF